MHKLNSGSYSVFWCHIMITDVFSENIDTVKVNDYAKKMHTFLIRNSKIGPWICCS